MRRNYLSRVLLMATLVLCFHSCTDRDEALPSQPKQERLSDNPHAISQEQALASLEDFLNSFDDAATRSAMKERRVKNIFPVEFQKDATRGAGADSIDCENLLYVVNFENEQGYAILAADDRVKDDVLAVVEQGSMSASTMKAAAGTITISERPIVSGFPTTGPGFFTSPKYPGETFMNPNTVDLADSIEGDTLVGNFDPMGANVTEPRDLTFTPNPGKEPIVDVNGELIGDLVYDKARNDLYDENNEGTGDGAWSKDKGGYMKIEYGDWKVAKSTPSLLDAFKGWNQHSPFNDLYPPCMNFETGEYLEHAHAGCVPLALAKVMTYLEIPENYVYKGHTIDWKAIKESAFQGTGREHAAMLLYKISKDCHSRYYYNGTFTFPFRAKRFLNDHGYSKVEKKHYSFTHVASMINKNHPVIFVSMPNIHITKSHCWNIDGYKVMKKETIYKYYSCNNKLVRTDYYQKENNMVHCDFGWGGRHNGYYTSGVFKLDDQDAEYDNINADNSLHTHYNNYKRIIYYECAK